MSVVTLDGQAFPSVINVRVDGRLRRYVPAAAGVSDALALADRLDGAGERLGNDLIRPCQLSIVADAIRDALGEVDACRRA